MESIYLDYAATTPVDPAVLEAMLPYFGAEYCHSEATGRRISKEILRFTQDDSGLFGNPSSIHSFGQRASAAVFKSRQTIAKVLGAHYSEIIFTSSATEANNLVLNSFADKRIIVSRVEHPCVIKPATKNKKAVFAAVSGSGLINLKKLKRQVNKDTALVSIILASNETGAVQNIKRISQVVKAKNPSTLIHTDAVQAFGYLACKPSELGVDLMTVSAHKIYGPKGVAFLYASKDAFAKLKPTNLGGAQEFGLRPGTENTAGIVGFARAVQLVEKNRKRENKRLATLRSYLWKEIKKIFPRAKLNGPAISSATRLPNNLNFYLPDLLAEEVVATLDLAGIAVSAGPACSSRSLDPSHTLLAMGATKERATNSLRVTLGRPTTKPELTRLIKELKKLKN